MRTAFHEQLDALTAAIADMCGVAGQAMQDATQALLAADAALAERVIGGHDEMMFSVVHAEEAAFTLLALQAPVATDLRVVVASLRNVADADRMGALGDARGENRAPPPPRARHTGGSQRFLR